MSATLLTKSLLLSAIECPTKLYYAEKTQYANQRSIDPLLKALAEGGYQVEALAKLYFPRGDEVKSQSIDEAVAETQKLLEQDKVTIFEAAIRHNNLFVRVDILVKNGNHFDLFEVKAKSYDPNSTVLIGKKGAVTAKWKPYIIDVAYQTHVLQMVYPHAIVNSYLMLANKNSVASTDGINQKFKIAHNGKHNISIKVNKDIAAADLIPELLIKVSVDEAIKSIFERELFPRGSFFSEIEFLSAQHFLGIKIQPILGGKCRDCEFWSKPNEEINGLKSGFKECWRQVLGWNESDFKEPNVLEISSLRKLDDWLAHGLVKIADVTKDDIAPSLSYKNGLSTSQRQWLQVEKVQNNDTSPYFDVPGFENEMRQWVFPLHFIDFETTTTALPFTKGRHPYELVAFQFSHHTIDLEGTVTHAGQYLNVRQGEFPNYNFVRQLKENLSNDEGTIFQYSHHENYTLTQIYHQLQVDKNSPHDKDELCEFIKNITKSLNKTQETWSGERSIVDMLELVKRYYYDPATHGSNSIKAVLPAMLNSSSFLKEKYSQPIYGTPNGIKSLNYQYWAWLKFADGQIINPYDRLPKLFDSVDQGKLDLLTSDDTLQEGGAALAAYCRMQFTEMSEYERNKLSHGLLNYCELDSLAMVMLFEGWQAMMKS